MTRQYTGVGAGTTAASADLGYWRYSLGLLSLEEALAKQKALLAGARGGAR